MISNVHPGMHAIDPNALLAAQMGHMHIAAAAAASGTNGAGQQQQQQRLCSEEQLGNM